VENANALLARIESACLWADFHKDWLLEMRALLRPQLPAPFQVFVESQTVLVSRPDAVGLSSSSLHGSAGIVELDEPYEIVSKYALIIRRTPENETIAALELLSPSNKGVGSRLDRQRYFARRDRFLDCGVNFLEIDALIRGERALPEGLQRLASYQRNAWTASFAAGRRKIRGWGWNDAEPLPLIPWRIDDEHRVLLDLAGAFQSACEFNRWDQRI
jgi:hypothetical protein